MDSYSERLTAIDAAFLGLEEPNVPMHVAAVGIVRADRDGPGGNGLDIERLYALLERSLGAVPRLRQRLAYVPVLRHPVWIDDDRFDLRYHVRHLALPEPGDLACLRRVVGPLLSSPLDRGKPMWEVWVLTGLEGDGAALVIKAHHCVVDALGGIALFSALLSSGEETERTAAWRPRPSPGAVRLLFAEFAHRVSWTAGLVRLLPRVLRDPGRVARNARERVLAIVEAARSGLSPATDTSLNRPIGPSRVLDWHRTELARVAIVRDRFGGTVNDVVLATVAGAVARFLRSRAEKIDERTVFRVEVPVSVRASSEAQSPGNRSVNFLAPLPVAEPDAVRRLHRTIATTTQLKSARLVAGAEVVEQVCDRSVPRLLPRLIRLSVDSGAFNLVVANVPGPPAAVALPGGTLTELYPVVPLLRSHTLGVALFSFDGSLCWGFHADRQAVPDLALFGRLIAEEFEALFSAAVRDRDEDEARAAGAAS